LADVTLRFLLAHGAGAPSSSAWMRRYAGHLGTLGSVRSFDYPYARAGAARKAPDKLDVLVAAHGAELQALRAESTATDKLILAGKSMGGRIGCHLALDPSAAAVVAGLVCFGYPLRGQNGKLRDEVLLALRTPVLFVQGTRDTLCALPELAEVRQRMSVRSELFVVEAGDHSLEATKTSLKQRGLTQAEVEQGIVAAVRDFCASI
jgi:predicted alpha/beta-hydrolase family hydrolase